MEKLSTESGDWSIRIPLSPPLCLRKMDKPVCECDVEKKKKEPVHVVLQVDLHCDGCISRIVRLAGCLEGL
ncbi:hypothetical protein YC2023_090667 [Brassica napus]